MTDSEHTRTPRDLSAEDLAFLARYRAMRTGNEEQNIDDLRQHVVDLWRSCLAEASTEYKCVRDLMFLETRIARHPNYENVIATLKVDPQARFLDLGCCFGTDTRRVIVDGWPEENVVPSDVVPDFWNYGLKLYDDASTLKAKLRMGDVTTDKEFVKSLAAGGLFAHVWTGAVLHVLNEEKVGALLRSIFTLLKPGGTYFGICAGLTDCPTAWQPEYANRSPAFLHTATSLEEVLRQVGFTEVNVTAEKRELFKEDNASQTGARPRAILRYQARKPLPAATEE